MNDEELDRHLKAMGLQEHEQLELKGLTGEGRLEQYTRYVEWQRWLKVHKKPWKFRAKLDANSIFFADGFTEKFRAIDNMIGTANVEFQQRIRAPKHDPSRHAFERAATLSDEGGKLMTELEEMVRHRLWSVAKEVGRFEES